MKQILIIIILIFLSERVLSQEKTQNARSQAEIFWTTPGRLIEKQFLIIGEVKGMSVQVLKMKDLNSGITMSALRFDRTSITGTPTRIAILDSDEIEGLLKSLITIVSSVYPSNRKTYTEVGFRSRTGFEAGVYYKNRWHGFVKLDEYSDDSQLLLDAQDFSLLMALIQTAKGKL